MPQPLPTYINSYPHARPLPQVVPQQPHGHENGAIELAKAEVFAQSYAEARKIGRPDPLHGQITIQRSSRSSVLPDGLHNKLANSPRRMRKVARTITLYVQPKHGQTHSGLHFANVILNRISGLRSGSVTKEIYTTLQTGTRHLLRRAHAEAQAYTHLPLPATLLANPATWTRVIP